MTITLGTVTIEPVHELDHWVFSTDEMFPQVTPALHAEPTIDMSITTYLVRTSGTTVLIDAGNGDAKHRPVLVAHDDLRAGYLDRLGALVAPEEVDVVVATHLHPDHCGGFTRLDGDDWVPAFPNARHLVSRTDLEWLSALHDAAPTDGPAADLARTWADSVAPVLDAGLLEPVDLPTEIADGVVLQAMAGHTAGHLVAEIRSDDETALAGGDVLHHPLQFADLDLAQSGDADPREAARSRRAVCDRLAASAGLLLPAHFAPGRVEADGDGFRFAALPS